MSLKVLQEKSQIDSARHELINMVVSSISSPLQNFLRRCRLSNSIAVGDKLKSWDVLSTLNFIKSRLKKDEPILDIGCYASEIVIALYKAGYSNLSGIDMNPDVQQMPYKNTIRYEVGDFMNTKFVDSSFSAITSISVIEHGFNDVALLKEMSRILKLGGYFIASFDYWSDKIDTTNEKLFGVDWKIFSKDEVKNFINQAADYGLYPAGEVTFECKERTIEFKDRQYTFAWLVLKKN